MPIPAVAAPAGRPLSGIGANACSVALAPALHDYFTSATTTTMARYHGSTDEVPEGLRIPHWSWDGLVGGLGPDGT